MPDVEKAETQERKEKYINFCQTIYTPIFSEAWWMDAICGSENWDVWIYEKGGSVLAAMPYYLEQRGEYRYITKPPLTQNNGLLIRYPQNQKRVKRTHYEEEIACAANAHIQSLGIDVYEQQFHYTYDNFLPWFWNRYVCIPRVTYVIEDTADMQTVESNISSKYRSVIRKGRRAASQFSAIAPETFYALHEKIFLRQGLKCPFSLEQWTRLYKACDMRGAGCILAAQDAQGDVLSLAYFVWDAESLYLLAGGPVPEHASLDTYDALVYEGILLASRKGLKFDFEGSVVRQINHSFREYGGAPKLYYRIRKVFNPNIVRKEAEEAIGLLHEISKH